MHLCDTHMHIVDVDSLSCKGTTIETFASEVKSDAFYLNK